ncbi:MAG: hypothetical protein ABL996_08295 [Micropepsaceae bacterium]
MWPLRVKSILEPDEEEWQIETWRWLIYERGGHEDIQESPLVCPTGSFFPASEAKGAQLAQHVFEHVKMHARMQDWPCELIEQPDTGGLTVNPVTALKVRKASPAGTFMHDGNAAQISYSPSLLKDRVALVSTLAHELAHYLIGHPKRMPPGGGSGLEPATDLTVAYLGFGIFGANSAFQYQQHQDFMSQGWGYSRLGYIKEREWVFALAIFLALKGLDASSAKPHLKPHLANQLKRVEKYLQLNPAILERIKSPSSQDQ